MKYQEALNIIEDHIVKEPREELAVNYNYFTPRWYAEVVGGSTGISGGNAETMKGAILSLAKALKKQQAFIEKNRSKKATIK